MRKNFLLLSILLVSFNMCVADTLRVLFIGNSYVTVNNLPDVISKIASSSGDSLYYQVSAPGGYTFEQHSTDPNTLSLIAQGNWDFVVLQEQSQRPSFEETQVAAEVYPYARKLDSLIHDAMGDCARVMFYMTWGRKNGDASNCAFWPPVCTYQGMDSLLQLRYITMAENNHAFISPVAKVWRNLRNSAPGIELYQADESHPTAAGTYAAAMSFYTMLFRKNPYETSFDYVLSGTNADMIRNAVNNEVFNYRREWEKFSPWPHVDSFSAQAIGPNTFNFTAHNPRNITSYTWIFGDGTPPSYMQSATHTYAGGAGYLACLVIGNACGVDTICREVMMNTNAINEPNMMQGVLVHPNPVQDYMLIGGLSGKTAYTITNVVGTTIKTGYVTPANNNINLAEASSGIYFLHLRNGKGQEYTTKIIRQ
jgi:PKD repeat protein